MKDEFKKNLEQSSYSLIKVLLQHLPGGTEKTMINFRADN
jgi:hypothetical protein